ncbi:GTP pyrophosphokinase [Leptospira santarosai]|uniref:GTP pyrophosphokinase n=1 Tax=Leptospira santarosai TaxID=28183 RepID=UPI0009C1148D|nr:RelA/SpoT [Leptospira santarosai]
MNETLLRDSFVQQAKSLQAWGDFVTDKITKPFADFIKIPSYARVKNADSFIEKALYRNKGYADPLNEISDKVGTRFVVLLIDHIKEIADFVEEDSIWEASKDRDYEAEIDRNPTLFNYQSVHYVVKNVSPVEYNDIEIPVGISCEIQIRTLLQHAYSEVTHDTIYKPKKRTNNGIARKVARSMALMEAADNTFSEAFREIREMEKEDHQILTLSRNIYESFTSSRYNERLSAYFIDSFLEDIKNYDRDKILSFILSRSDLQERIMERKDKSLIIGQPLVILLYMLIEQMPNKVKKLWPLTPSELQPLFNDLGIAFDPD